MKLDKKILLLTALCSSIYSSEKEEGIASYHLSTTATKDAWHRIGEGDHYGIDVPLLSLKSTSNYGCGDFYDIFPLIDWIRSMGMDILQFLPLNDTGDIVSPYTGPTGLSSRSMS